MSPAVEASFELEYPDGQRAQRVEQSLRPELGEIDGDRCVTRLERRGGTIIVDVTADDPVALRAATNTWLSLAGVAEAAAENVDF